MSIVFIFCVFFLHCFSLTPNDVKISHEKRAISSHIKNIFLRLYQCPKMEIQKGISEMLMLSNNMICCRPQCPGFTDASCPAVFTTTKHVCVLFLIPTTSYCPIYQSRRDHECYLDRILAPKSTKNLAKSFITLNRV